MSESGLRVFRTSEQSPEEIVKQSAPPAAELARVQAAVDEIIARVRAEGDGAVLEYVRRFDWEEASLERLVVTEAELERAQASVAPAVMGAMTRAAENIRGYHERQLPQDWFEELEDGLSLGQRHTPVDSAACYVPTSRASLPSSLLMSAVPAQVAGVPRIVVVGPCNFEGALPAGVLAAARLLGITEVYKLGGAVAMAALAFGTPTFPKVDKIVGPANIYGTLAKKALYGEVGVDGLYGPSDVAIIADGSVPAAWIATDMLSQAEHGEDSPGVLVTPDGAYARAVADEVVKQVETSPRRHILAASLSRFGAIIVVRNLDEAVAVVNLLAPEHLELATEDPRALLPAIRHAGAVFLGGYTPVPVGDYYAGPSHVLPTGRTARFSSGLGVLDFLKRSSLIETDPAWLGRHADDITALADHEGLDAHAEAVHRRV